MQDPFRPWRFHLLMIDVRLWRSILGAGRDGALTQYLATTGARIDESVGKTRTALIINSEPHGHLRASGADHRRMEQLRAA